MLEVTVLGPHPIPTDSKTGVAAQVMGWGVGMGLLSPTGDSGVHSSLRTVNLIRLPPPFSRDLFPIAYGPPAKF